MINKRIFITGGAGFIANKIIGKYIENNLIVVYDNFSRDTLSNSELASHPNIKVVKGDVLDFEHLKSSMEGSQVVIHAAGIAGINTVIKDPVQTIKVNSIGTYNALQAALENNVGGRFIDFSTSEIFGSRAYKSEENDEAVSGSAGEARWTYAVSKLLGEHLAHAYHRQYNLPTVTVRPFNIYGPGQTGEGALIGFIKKAIKNEEITIYGDGSQIRAWCFVDDFIECIDKCLISPDAIGNSFNIGNSRAIITIYGLAQMICRVLGSSSKITFKEPLSADIELRIPSVDKSKDILNFESKVDLDEGILATANWIKENYNI